MNNIIFNSVANTLEAVSRITRLTYNQINIILYYFLIPFSWFLMLDIIFEFHYLKMAFVIFTIGFFVGCRDFRTYSDWLFYRSVVFLNYFNKFGSSYLISSVWICVSIPIAIYVLLFYLILSN